VRKLGLLLCLTALIAACERARPAELLICSQAARRYHELIPGSELLVLEQTGHLPQEERPERMVAEITRWVEAHP